MSDPSMGEPPKGFEDTPGTPASEPPVVPIDEPRPAPVSGGDTAAGATVPRTKTGIAFGSLIAGAIVLIVLLVFILENTESVRVSFLGAGGRLPLGVALLLAAIGGGLLVGVVGTARIIQLRRHVRRRR
jgi:lipopolysaccharide assembly protein A